MTVDRILCIAALVPTAIVVALGIHTAVLEPAYHLANHSDGRLEYADGEKAVLKTPTGTRLVFVGTTLPAAGHVESITKRDGHWTVATTAGLLFVED